MDVENILDAAWEAQAACNGDDLAKVQAALVAALREMATETVKDDGSFENQNAAIVFRQAADEIERHK